MFRGYSRNWGTWIVEGRYKNQGCEYKVVRASTFEGVLWSL